MKLSKALEKSRIAYAKIDDVLYFVTSTAAYYVKGNSDGLVKSFAKLAGVDTWKAMGYKDTEKDDAE